MGLQVFTACGFETGFELGLQVTIGTFRLSRKHTVFGVLQPGNTVQDDVTRTLAEQ